FTPERCAAGVVLTGGSAKLPGLAEAAAKIFGVPAHIGELPGVVDERLRDPALATVVGLLHFGLQSRTEAAPPRRAGGGFIQDIKKLFAVGA
ncbi:MAG TPA: cell division protein FtsA, partial [Opitutaceae bacterium]